MEQTAPEDLPTKNKLAAGSHHEEGKIENISSADDNSGVSSRIGDVLCKWTCIGIGTLLGLLSRAGIIVSSELLKTELSGIVWTNFVACFCMGLFVKAFSILELPKTQNVYLGLTTGYCGTFSSFSSAALELFNVAAGRIHQQPNTTKSSHNITPTIIVTNVSNFAGSTFVHIGVSFIGYHLGETTATLILHGRSNAFLGGCRRHHLSLKIASISVLTMIIIASLLLTYLYGTSNYFIYVSSALLFALPGTCLRFYLSNTLNFDKRKNQKRLFPVGTFTANALGSLVLASSTLLTLGTKPNNVPDEMIISDQLLCSILSAIGLGFCGALTTMSTFISELTTMENRNYLYLYAISSVFVTVGSFVALWGTYSWSVGCFVCVRMEPIKAPVWDDPVPKEPYKLKDLPRTTANDSIPNPCSTGKSSFDSGDAPPPEWTRRGRRNAVWEITLDPALMSETVCCVEQPPDLDTCYRVCFCTRRNGLQDSCPLTGCGGKPRCLTTPLPSCDPSGFAPKKSSKDVEYILCPAIRRESKRSLCKRHPSSAPVSQASHCDPKSTKTY